MALSEGVYTAEFVLTLSRGDLSKDDVTVTVPASDTLKAGQVMAKVTATGKYGRYDDTLTDGSENAAGILWSPQVNATLAAVDVTATIVNYAAEVRNSDLEWNSKTQSTGKVELAALGVKVRA